MSNGHSACAFLLELLICETYTFFWWGGEWVIFVTVIGFPCAGGSPETAEVMERLRAQLSSFKRGILDGVGWEDISTRTKPAVCLQMLGPASSSKARKDMKHILYPPRFPFSFSWVTRFLIKAGLLCVCVLLSQSRLFLISLSCETISCICSLRFCCNLLNLVSKHRGHCYESIFLSIIESGPWTQEKNDFRLCQHWDLLPGVSYSDFPMFKANVLHAVPHSSLHPVACLSSASGGHVSDKNPKATFFFFVYRQCHREGISLQGGIIVPVHWRWRQWKLLGRSYLPTIFLA